MKHFPPNRCLGLLAGVLLTSFLSQACAETPTYGRVDMVRDNAGELAVMELELVEPELWMRRHPPAAERFAARLYELVSAAASSP